MEMIAIKIQPFLSYHNPKIIVSQRQSGCVCKRKCFSLKLGYGAHQLRQMSTHEFLLTIQAVSPGMRDIEVSSSEEDFTTTASYSDQDNKLKITVEVSGAKTQEIFDNVFSKMVADAQPIPGFRRVKGGKTPNIPKNILLEILGPSKVYEQVIKKVINSAIAEYVAKFQTYLSFLRTATSYQDQFSSYQNSQLKLSSLALSQVKKESQAFCIIPVGGAAVTDRTIVALDITPASLCLEAVHFLSTLEWEHLTVGKDLRVEQSFEDLEAGFKPGEIFRFDAIIQCQDSLVE